MRSLQFNERLLIISESWAYHHNASEGKRRNSDFPLALCFMKPYKRLLLKSTHLLMKDFMLRWSLSLATWLLRVHTVDKREVELALFEIGGSDLDADGVT